MKWFWFLAALLASGCTPAVRVGSKAFTEGVLLGELETQLARSSGVPAEHRQQLGGTQILWQALRRGDIDAYVDYTGTVREEILAGQRLPDDAALRVALAGLGIRMSRPLGFINTYALGMREDVAEKLDVRTISDLRNHPDLKLGFSNEFMGRADGWPGLREQYDLPQRNVRGLDHSLAYQALRSGDIQAMELYSTDPKIRTFHLRILEDDRHLFPSYEAVMLYRDELERTQPQALAAMLKLEGRIPADAMIDMNARVEEEGIPPSRVAADFLAERLNVRTEVRGESAWAELLRHAGEHLFLVVVSLAAAIVLAVPLGIVSARRPALGQVVLGAVGIVQTVPSLALLVFMIPLLGTGGLPAIVALFLYSLLPIVRNTYAGLHDIAPNLREAAAALGLPPGARLRLVELPLAARSIMAGIKTAAVINVGTATIGALIGAGGFGQPIITGIQRFDLGMVIWQGAVPAAALALLVQGLFELAERAVVPRGLRLGEKSP